MNIVSLHVNFQVTKYTYIFLHFLALLGLLGSVISSESRGSLSLEHGCVRGVFSRISHNRLNQAESADFELCMLSVFPKDPSFRLFKKYIYIYHLRLKNILRQLYS